MRRFLTVFAVVVVALVLALTLQAGPVTAQLFPFSVLLPLVQNNTAACTERVSNGGFEATAAWTFPNTPNDAGYTTVQKFAGARAARFGLPPGTVPTIMPAKGVESVNLLGEIAPEGAGYSSGYQTISIPATATKTTLSFWYNPGTADPVNDWQRVLLLDTNYAYVATLWVGAENDQVWKQRIIDLTAYRGRSLVLYFETYNNETLGTARTWMYLDEVHIQACSTPTPTPSPTPIPVGISGKLTYKGATLPNTTVTLQRWDGTSRFFTGKSATSGADGRYLFTGVPTLPAGSVYFVYFGVNTIRPLYVSDWFGPDITSYTAGASASGGNFDLADVDLISPVTESMVTLPATFTWVKRTPAGQTYKWCMFDPAATANEWCTGYLGDVGSVVINTLPAGATTGKAYRWFVEVSDAPGSFGWSFEARPVAFATLGPAGSGEAASPDPNGVDALPRSDSLLHRRGNPPPVLDEVQ